MEEKTIGEPGSLFIVATPIGNLSDMSMRAIDTLKDVDLILAEDTRVSAKLLNKYDINTEMLSYRDQNHKRILPLAYEKLLIGQNLALISDAGTPAISDPGYKLIRELIKKNIEVVSIPGASSVISALVASGLPTDKFLFLGFLPKGKGKLEKILSKELSEDKSIIIFESPFRILKLLETICSIDDKRYLALVNDQTKLHEKILRGTCKELIGKLGDMAKFKGEFVVVVGKPGFDLLK